MFVTVFANWRYGETKRIRPGGVMNQKPEKRPDTKPPEEPKAEEALHEENKVNADSESSTVPEDYPQPEPLENVDVSPTEAPPAFEPKPTPQAADDGDYRGVPLELDEDDESIVTPLPEEVASWAPIIKWGAIIAGVTMVLYLLFRKKD